MFSHNDQKLTDKTVSISNLYLITSWFNIFSVHDRILCISCRVPSQSPTVLDDLPTSTCCVFEEQQVDHQLSFLHLRLKIKLIRQLLITQIIIEISDDKLILYTYTPSLPSSYSFESSKSGGCAVDCVEVDFASKSVSIPWNRSRRESNENCLPDIKIPFILRRISRSHKDVVIVLNTFPYNTYADYSELGFSKLQTTPEYRCG